MKTRTPWIRHGMNEARRSLALARRYWVETVLGLGFVVSLFGGLVFAVLKASGQTLDSGQADGLITGFALWMFASGLAHGSAKEITEETEQRTLEQLQLAPLSLERLLAVRLVLETAMGLILLVLTLGLIALLTAGRVQLGLPALGLALMGAPAMAGLGYALAGLSLLVKRGELLMIAALPSGDRPGVPARLATLGSFGPALCPGGSDGASGGGRHRCPGRGLGLGGTQQRGLSRAGPGRVPRVPAASPAPGCTRPHLKRRLGGIYTAAMDAIVEAALKKWPNVPHCYGWLALDARGDWYMRDERCQAAGPFPQVKGSRVTHEKLREFIARNYAADARGAWFFQNGPQRVYLQLEAAPWVWRVDAAALQPGGTMQSHTGLSTTVSASWLDEARPPVPEHALGPGPGAQPGHGLGGPGRGAGPVGARVLPPCRLAAALWCLPGARGGRGRVGRLTVRPGLAAAGHESGRQARRCPAQCGRLTPTQRHVRPPFHRPIDRP